MKRLAALFFIADEADEEDDAEQRSCDRLFGTRITRKVTRSTRMKDADSTEDFFLLEARSSQLLSQMSGSYKMTLINTNP